MITRPSPGVQLAAAGVYEITGVAWSGYGKIAKVDVSADGGKSWAAAMLQEPVLPMALTRFRIPWQWDGRPGRAAEPHGGRFGLYPAQPRPTDHRARRQDHIPLQWHHQLGCIRKRRVVTCLCIGCCSPRRGCWLFSAASLGERPEPRAARHRLRILPPGISALRRTAVACRVAAERLSRARLCTSTACLTCHGERGTGKPNDALAGGKGTLAGDAVPVKTVGSFWPYATTLFDYVRRAMPLPRQIADR